MSSTHYPSSIRDHSVNSAARPTRFEIGLQTKSLANCCPKKIFLLIPIIIILGTYGFMVDQGLYCHTTITDINITINELPPSMNISIPILPYIDTKTINGPSIPSSISWFWSGNAHYNAIINCFCSIIWPFLSGIILLHLFFVPFKIINQRYRTISLCVIMQTGKFAFVQAFCGVYDGIVNFVDKETEIFQFEIISAPSNEYANYTTICAVFGILAFFLLTIDQIFMYNDKILKFNQFNKNEENLIKCSYYRRIKCIYPENKWFWLLFVNKRRSKMAIVFDAIFFTVLCSSIWILFQSLYTAQVGFNIGGLFGGDVVIKSAQNIGITAANYLVLENETQKIFVEQFLILAVIIPLMVQCLIVFVWFIPLNVKLFRWLIRIIFILQSLNGLEVYFISALLCFEFKDYTKWFSANKGGSPQLCGVDTPIYENMGGCIYADPFFNDNGIILMIAACFIQWITFIYTIYTANKIGINVIRFK